MADLAQSDVLVAILLAALAAVLVLLVQPLFGGRKRALHDADWSRSASSWPWDLDQWAADLRVLATSLRLGHWAMCATRCSGARWIRSLRWWTRWIGIRSAASGRRCWRCPR